MPLHSNFFYNRSLLRSSSYAGQVASTQGHNKEGEIEETDLMTGTAILEATIEG